MEAVTPISEETRAVLLRLYALHDRLAAAVCRASLPGLLGEPLTDRAVAAINEADQLCDEIEHVFGAYLTAEECGMTEEA